MTLRKVSLYDMMGSHPTKEGRAAVRRAMEYAAKEQQKILDAAKKLK